MDVVQLQVLANIQELHLNHIKLSHLAITPLFGRLVVAFPPRAVENGLCSQRGSENWVRGRESAKAGAADVGRLRVEGCGKGWVVIFWELSSAKEPVPGGSLGGSFSSFSH
jgi:hypothetical protein